MRFRLLAVAFAFAAGLTGSAQTVPDQTWKAVFTGPIGDRPKMFSEVVMDWKVRGGVITGTAHAGNWPGNAPISDGVLSGKKFSFTAIGTLGSSTGFPKMDFEGTIDGDKMDVTMMFGYVDSYMVPRKLPMSGSRVH
jgi:hypothetical protein